MRDVTFAYSPPPSPYFLLRGLSCIRVARRADFSSLVADGCPLARMHGPGFERRQRGTWREKLQMKWILLQLQLAVADIWRTWQPSSLSSCFVGHVFTYNLVFVVTVHVGDLFSSLLLDGHGDAARPNETGTKTWTEVGRAEHAGPSKWTLIHGIQSLASSPQGRPLDSGSWCKRHLASGHA